MADVNSAFERAVTGLGPPSDQDPIQDRAEALMEIALQPEKGMLGIGETVTVPPIKSEGGAPGMRTALAFAGDTLEERRAVFLRLHPQGTLDKDPVTGNTVFRLNPTEPLRELDPNMFAQLFAGQLPSGREMVADIGEFAGEQGPQLAGEIAGVVGRTGSLGRLLGGTGGGAAGQVVRQSAQTLLGTQGESLRDQADRIVGSAAEGLFGTIAGDVIALGLNRLRGAGALGTDEAGRSISRAADELDISLIPPEVTDVGIIKRVFDQAAAILPKLQRFATVERGKLTKMLTAKGDQLRADGSIPSRDIIVKQVGQALERANKEIVESVLKKPRNIRSGSVVTRAGVKAWDASSRKTVDDAYDISRAEEEPTFSFDAAYGDRESVTDTITDILGQTEVEAAARGGGANVPVGAGVDSRLQKVLDDIQKIDPTQPLKPVVAIQQSLHDLTLVPPEGALQVNLQAKRLFGSLNRMLDNPVSGSSEAYKAARSIAAQRFRTRDQLAIVTNVQPGQPSALMLNKAMPAPGQGGADILDNLIVLRKALTGKLGSTAETQRAWNGYREAWLTEAIRRDLPKVVDELRGTKAFNVLFTKTEQAGLQKAAVGIKRLQSAGLDDVAAMDASVRDVVGRIFTGTPDANKVLREVITRNGGKTGPLGTSIRAAIMDAIAEGTIEMSERSLRVINPGLLTSRIDTLKKAGAIRLLQSGDLRFLKNVEKVSRAQAKTKDTGTSLVAGEVAGGVRELKPQALMSILSALTFGRIATLPGFRGLLVGRGQTPKVFNDIRAIALAATNSAAEIEKTKKRGAEIIDGVNDLIQAINPSVQTGP